MLANPRPIIIPSLYISIFNYIKKNKIILKLLIFLRKLCQVRQFNEPKNE